MKKQFLLAGVAACVLGTAAHFFYDWFPTPLIGLFTPVNESIWEHLKLLFWPTILAGVWLARKSGQPQRLWGAILWAVLAMPPALLSVYYVLNAGFAVESLIVDIILYYLTMAGGFYLAYRLYLRGGTEKQTGFLVMAAGLYGLALTVFTLSAPNLPIFVPKI